MQQTSLNVLLLPMHLLYVFFQGIRQASCPPPLKTLLLKRLFSLNTLPKALKTLLLLGLICLAPHTQGKENIDLLIVVEPNVFAENNPERLSRESLQAAIEQQLNTANALYNLANIHYSLVAILDWEDNAVSQQLSQGDDYQQALSHLMSAISDPTDSFNTADLRAKTYLQQFFADKLIFITQEHDLSVEPFGKAFYQAGISVHAPALMTMPSVLAHLLGHTLALEHPSTDICQSIALVMCSPYGSRLSLSINDMTWLGRLVKGQDIPVKAHFDNRLYLGALSPAMPKIARIQLQIQQSQLSNQQRHTQAILQLINDAGERQPLEQDTSVELFTRSGTAVAAYHYPASFYQRIVFLAGETQKKISLEIQPSSQYANFSIGTRYGLMVEDSNVQQVNIIGDISNTGPSAPTEPVDPTKEMNPNPNPSAPIIDNDSNNNSGDNSNTDNVSSTKDDASSIAYLSLLILLIFVFIKKIEQKKPPNK
ncbi:hypothetical protein [uncultured Shewanella sp.]|uniref:hypothetical protein n=1 Tax=uncultured Shewanella sp. TaxID=173975 RepID=UPI002625ABFB|nr:hypothetical protein [uncultured Shewanella sp.]